MSPAVQRWNNEAQKKLTSCSSSLSLCCRFYFLPHPKYISSFTIAILHKTKSETIAQPKTSSEWKRRRHNFVFSRYSLLFFFVSFALATHCHKNYSSVVSFSRLSAAAAAASQQAHWEKVTLYIPYDTADFSRHFCPFLFLLFGSKVRFIVPPHQKLFFWLVCFSIGFLRSFNQFFALAFHWAFEHFSFCLICPKFVTLSSQRLCEGAQHQYQ